MSKKSKITPVSFLKKREEQLIRDCLETVVRPQIQSHNGDIELVSYDNNIVIVNLKGACVGCPLSMYTLTMGILEELKKVVPSVQEVINKEQD